MPLVQLMTITVDGNETRIESFKYVLQRDVDKHRRPSGVVKIPTIRIKRDSLEDRGAILNWMAESDRGKDVSIKGYGDMRKSNQLTEIKLENAFIIGYTESFGEEANQGLIEYFDITSEKMDVDGNRFDEVFPGA